MKKVYLVIAVIAVITCLTGIPYLVEALPQEDGAV